MNLKKYINIRIYIKTKNNDGKYIEPLHNCVNIVKLSK